MTKPELEFPDTMLPVQFFTRTAIWNAPEKRLILAVLMDAVRQLQRGDAQSIADAERWIRDEIEDPPIRFAHACEVLGLEARSFAESLMLWRNYRTWGSSKLPEKADGSPTCKRIRRE